MSKITTNSNNRGFTLVELLIVIVIIAILAAISIVAYNGIQNRARNSAAAEAASQLATKIEVWNGTKAVYPTYTEVKPASGNGLVDTDVTEAEIDEGVLSKIGSDDPTLSANHVSYRQCNSGAGAVIEYYQSAGNKTINKGNVAGC